MAEDAARGGIFLVSGAIISSIITAVAAVIVARYLGPELYGLFALSVVLPQLFILLTDFGIEQGIVKFVAEARAKHEITHAKEIIKYGLLTKLFISIILFIILFISADFLAKEVMNRPQIGFYIRLSSISIIFQTISSTLSFGYIGLGRTEFSALTMNIQAISKGLISTVLVIFGFSIVGALIGFTSGFVIAGITALALFVYFLKKSSTVTLVHAKSTIIKPLLYYGMPIFISSMLMGFIAPYQNIILAFFSSDVEIGYFKVTANFIILLTTVTAQITTALLPAFSKLQSTNNAEPKQFFKLANKYVTLLTIPIVTFLIVFSTEIVQIIYGPAFEASAVFLALYSMLYFLVGFGYLILPSLFNGLNEPKETFKMSLITFLIVLLLSPFATLTYSVIGLIIVFLVAHIAGTFYGMFVANKKFQMRINLSFLTKIYITGLVSIVPGIIIQMTNIHVLLKLVLGGVTFFPIYFSITTLINVISDQEFEIATKVIQKIKPLYLLGKFVTAYRKKLIEIQQSFQKKLKLLK